MSNELEGKIAVVTGGASGMGRETVRVFCEEGARVVIADIQDEAGEQFAKDLGAVAVYRRCDVSKAAEVDALVQFAISHFGRLDIMFNNAGVTGDMKPVEFLDEDFEDFSKVMSVDLLGVMLGCKYAGKVMAKQGSGAIINTASTAGFYAGHGIPVYRAAKAGVINITQNAAIALGPYGVRVNAISPGPIETPIFLPDVAMPAEKLKKLSRDVMDAMIDMQPLKRYGQPRDIANAAVFLGSERSAQITGQNLVVAGGMGIGDNIDRRVGIGNAIMRALADNA